jgi:integrase
MVFHGISLAKVDREVDMGATNRLTALEVKNSAPGKYADGGGLWLHRRRDGGGQWFLRVTVHGRRREMGLGSITHVSLKEARAEAEFWRSFARQGKDPIKERERRRREAERSDTSLTSIALAAFEAKKAELKGDGKAGRWLSPLELHVLPKLGKVPIEEVDQRDISSVLSPIWHTKGETARKAMNRIGIVLRYAAAMGLDVDLQATQKAKELLGKSRQKLQHIPALDWRELPAFYTSLRDGTLTELALRLLILTAVRSGSLRHARWEHIEGDIWTIPAENMKGKVGRTDAFRVPLSSEAKLVLDSLKDFQRDGLVLPGLKRGVMSDMTMSQYLKDRGHPFRPHGFRSSFRTWCSEATDTPREISEKALAHSVGTSVERSYNRTDFLERRSLLMESWGDYVAQRRPKERRSLRLR